MAKISTVDELRGRYREPVERVVRKELDRLDEHCRTYIGSAPFLVIATVGRDGRLDASPRGDRAGFVQIPDERTLLIPDWPGNNRLDSLTNLVEHPRAGLIFMIPGVDETLRVNGIVAIHDDDDLRDRFVTGDRRPAVCWSSPWSRRTFTARRRSCAPACGTRRPGRPSARSRPWAR